MTNNLAQTKAHRCSSRPGYAHCTGINNAHLTNQPKRARCRPQQLTSSLDVTAIGVEAQPEVQRSSRSRLRLGLGLVVAKDLLVPEVMQGELWVAVGSKQRDIRLGMHHLVTRR